MLKGSLRLTVVVEAELVDRGIADGPSVGDIPLLKSFVVDRSETGHVRTGSLELGKRRDKVVVVEIVVEAEVLLVVEAVVDSDCELITALGLHRCGLESTAAIGWGGDKLQ